ncbi:piggyBac transposable element-derived protein 4-like [Maniola jurtina]|uniref:piggyBac transposable element-derived protein 4-like n=1 Tax=Maniola jurtina TaxID=191418 RepID=UPI001E68A76F|nr:piggyBac transposable element-derived protein 4-like [Maniola jurtina]
MNKKKNKILSDREVEEIVNNLSDLSDLDSDDDVYYQTAPVTSPADYCNLPEDIIIERRLEELFGVREISEENIDIVDRELYSVSCLKDILEENCPDSSVGDTAGQLSGDQLTKATDEHMQEERGQDLTEREIEIQQCFEEIYEDNHPIQADDTNAGPLNINYYETENQTLQCQRIVNVSRTRQPREWKIEKEIHSVPEFINPIRPQSTYNHKTQPIYVFEKFFPEYLVQVIVEQSNIYAAQKKSNNFTPISAEELKAYFGILIMMGLNPLPDMDLFKKITENLHINNNENEPDRSSPDYDKLFKLRPMITELNKVYQEETANSSHQSIDECMVKFKGRSSLKQYMPKKPIKRGFKVWARCDAKTGYLYTFQVYTGKGDNMEDEGLGYNVVMKLATDLPENTLLAFDNFFTGCNLMEDLYKKKIFAVGTVRANRKDLPNIMKKSQPKHLRLQKNQFAAVTAKPITAIKWLDTRDVNVLTTAHHPTDTVLVKRTQKDGTKKEILCPKAIACYTLTMGGVDRFDHFRSSYPINRKCRKFWMRLFFFMFDASIINSYITYSTTHVVNTHSHREFRLRLARGLAPY